MASASAAIPAIGVRSSRATLSTKARRTSSTRRRSEASSTMATAPSVRQSSSTGATATRSVRACDPGTSTVSSVGVPPSACPTSSRTASSAGPGVTRSRPAPLRYTTSPCSSHTTTPSPTASRAHVRRSAVTPASPTSVTACSAVRSSRVSLRSIPRPAASWGSAPSRRAMADTRRPVEMRVAIVHTSTSSTAPPAPANTAMSTPVRRIASMLRPWPTQEVVAGLRNSAAIISAASVRSVARSPVRPVTVT